MTLSVAPDVLEDPASKRTLEAYHIQSTVNPGILATSTPNVSWSAEPGTTLYRILSPSFPLIQINNSTSY